MGSAASLLLFPVSLSERFREEFPDHLGEVALGLLLGEVGHSLEAFGAEPYRYVLPWTHTTVYHVVTQNWIDLRKLGTRACRASGRVA